MANLFLNNSSRTFLALELDVPEKKLHDRIVGLSELNKAPQKRMQKYNPATMAIPYAKFPALLAKTKA